MLWIMGHGTGGWDLDEEAEHLHSSKLQTFWEATAHAISMQYKRRIRNTNFGFDKKIQRPNIRMVECSVSDKDSTK